MSKLRLSLGALSTAISPHSPAPLTTPPSFSTFKPATESEVSKILLNLHTSILFGNTTNIMQKYVEVKGKGILYSYSQRIVSGANPCLFAVSLCMVESQIGSRYATTPMVTFPAAEHHHPPLACNPSTKLYLVMETHRCE